MAQWLKVHITVVEDGVQLPSQVAKLPTTPDPTDQMPLAFTGTCARVHTCFPTPTYLKIKFYYSLRKTNSTGVWGDQGKKKRRKERVGGGLTIWSIASCPRSRHWLSEKHESFLTSSKFQVKT